MEGREKVVNVNIPDNIKKMVEDNQEKDNVLLLAMSTLPKYVVENKFCYEDEVFICKSQLAPETECIMSLLAKDKKHLDRIVVLGSQEAFDKIHDVECVAAYDFYMNEITKFVESRQDIKFDCDNGFMSIRLHEVAALIKAVEAIKGDGITPVDLFIDVQGGRRSETTAMIAITELLRKQNVSIKGRYANDFAPTEKGPYKIHTVDEEYKAYDLVFAMNEFERYGRGEALKAFFEGKDDEFARVLSEVIDDVARSIQLCDMDNFGKAIKKIKELNVKYNAVDTSDELKIIYKDIIDDYKAIADSLDDYVSQINWCLEKGFIQQALTLIESKMPEKIVGTNYFDVKFAEKTNVLSNYTNGEIIDFKKLNWEKRENFILRRWAENTKTNSNQKASGIRTNSQLYYINLDGSLKKSWENMITDQNIPQFGNINIKFYDPIAQSDCVEPVEVFNVANGEQNKLFCLFMKLHMELRAQRNYVNHGADGPRKSIDCINDAIQAYIDIARRLGF